MNNIKTKAAKTFAPVSNTTAQRLPQFMCAWWLHKREVPAKLMNRFEVLCEK